jgi:hypothetical protein
VSSYQNIKSNILRDLKYGVLGLARSMHIREHEIRALLNSDLPVDMGMRTWRARSGQDEHQTLLDDSISGYKQIELSQTIIFGSEQAHVFKDLAESYTESLDYRLPFPHTFIQFTSPLSWTLENTTLDLLGICLSQYAFDSDFEVKTDSTGRGNLAFLDPESEKDTATLNHLTAILNHEEGGIGGYWLSWKSAGRDMWLARGCKGSDELKNLAIACIGYINCENIYLHKEGGAPEAVNRKRERQGKKILEPYYVCRIKGVQYDSNGNATGEGTHHGFRYDVRGHFRKLSSGKTTWVRPHQRGIQNELYIPKTYVVTK